MSKPVFIADIAYEDPPYSKKYHKVGAITYRESSQGDVEVKVRIDTCPPLGILCIGLFLNTLDEAPYIDGDLIKKGVKYGHIHCSQDAIGRSLYWVELTNEYTGWLVYEDMLPY